MATGAAMNTIFVIDSHAERRAEVCRVLLQGERHAEPFETIEEFLAFSRSDGVALVHDAGQSLIRLSDKLRDNSRLVPMVGFDASPQLANVVTAMQAGTASYLAWPFTLQEFDAEMSRIDAGLRREMDRKRRSARARSQLASLTGREREVLVSLISHGTNKAIAKQLDISPRTVEKYRAAILVRLGVANSAQAIRVAVEGGAFDESEDDTQGISSGFDDRDDAMIS